MEFAALLKQYRVQAGLSQQSLADRALISVQAVSALERGYRRAPYRDTLDRLAEALGLSPEARTAFDAAARRGRGSRAIEQETSPAHNLPRQLTSFLGRDDVVREISTLVAGAPLVSIVGTGGAGKTRAAIEVGTQLLSRFPDGVWFVELAPLEDAALVIHTVAAALHVHESPQRSLLAALVAYLDRKQLLLIVDNCEHLIAQVRTVVGSLLRECPNLRVLATSREALTVAGERAYRIPPLAVPKHEAISPHDAMEYGAVALFADRASAADSRFAVTEDNVSPVVEICRRLDGLPFAIELAAARAAVLSPSQIAQRLDRVFDVLATNGHVTLSRHETMRAVVDWSYALLSSHAQLLFCRLAIFPASFALESAVTVCGNGDLSENDVLELLSSLVARSLVMVDFPLGDARYHLLEATRQYAVERLVERGEWEALALRHVHACLLVAQRLDSEWYEAPERMWFGEAEAELDNCRAALAWSLAQKHDVLTGCRLAAALARIWYSLSPLEGRRWVQAAIEALDDATPPSIAAELDVAQARLCAAFGEYTASLAAAERALQQSDILDALQVVHAKLAAGDALSALGKREEAEALLTEALATAESLGNRRLGALALGELGTVRSRGGDVGEARRFYADALAHYVSLGVERPAASIAGHLAEVEFAAGNITEALRYAQEARRGHEATHNHRSVANDLSNIAAYFVALERHDDAHQAALQALRVARDVQATVLTAYVLQHLAAVAALGPFRDEPRAAMLIGFVDARLNALKAKREYTEQQEYDRLMEALRAAIGSTKVTHFMAAGAEWTEDQAVAHAAFKVSAV